MQYWGHMSKKLICAAFFNTVLSCTEESFVLYLRDDLGPVISGTLSGAVMCVLCYTKIYCFALPYILKLGESDCANH